MWCTNVMVKEKIQVGFVCSECHEIKLFQFKTVNRIR